MFDRAKTYIHFFEIGKDAMLEGEDLYRFSLFSLEWTMRFFEGEFSSNDNTHCGIYHDERYAREWAERFRYGKEYNLADNDRMQILIDIDGGLPHAKKRYVRFLHKWYGDKEYEIRLNDGRIEEQIKKRFEPFVDKR